MIKKPVTIQNNMEMEDRPIAHLVQEASQYSSQVYLEMGSKKINAKSIMGIMGLGLDRGRTDTIEAAGEDEEEAIAAISEFLEK